MGPMARGQRGRHRRTQPAGRGWEMTAAQRGLGVHRGSCCTGLDEPPPSRCSGPLVSASPTIPSVASPGSLRAKGSQVMVGGQVRQQDVN